MLACLEERQALRQRGRLFFFADRRSALGLHLIATIGGGGGGYRLASCRSGRRHGGGWASQAVQLGIHLHEHSETKLQSMACWVTCAHCQAGNLAQRTTDEREAAEALKTATIRN
jgi:hypothetical protein